MKLLQIKFTFYSVTLNIDVMCAIYYIYKVL